MATKLAFDSPKSRLMEMRALTPPLSQASPIVCTIQNKLRRLLERNVSSGGVPSITLPSVIQLSGIFRCSELDVLTALNVLLQEGFQYELSGLDSPVLFRDTLFPNKAKSSFGRS